MSAKYTKLPTDDVESTAIELGSPFSYTDTNQKHPKYFSYFTNEKNYKSIFKYSGQNCDGNFLAGPGMSNTLKVTTVMKCSCKIRRQSFGTLLSCRCSRVEFVWKALCWTDHSHLLLVCVHCFSVHLVGESSGKNIFEFSPRHSVGPVSRLYFSRADGLFCLTTGCTRNWKARYLQVGATSASKRSRWVELEVVWMGRDVVLFSLLTRTSLWFSALQEPRSFCHVWIEWQGWTWKRERSVSRLKR